MTNPIESRQPLLPKNGGSRPVALEELHNIFIQNVSHEFRTPLSILQGYAELLHSGDLGPLAPEQRRATEIMVDRARSLQKLVERIGVLLSTRARASLSMPLALAGIAATVVEGKREAATEAGLILETHIEQEVPLVSGDPDKVRAAIDCLLDNALKFTPRGGRVDVRVCSEANWVCVQVSDTGIGLKKEETERIFSPFYQLDGSTTRRYGGLGLGLGLVKAVVAEHGGQIEVTSEPGRGSNFTVKLPAISSEAPLALPVSDGAGLRRILVVDDEENVALIIQDGLEKLPNCEVSVATSGEEALRLFEQNPFDLLITDYKMPGTDGMALSSRVRELYPHTAIIMITAYGDHMLRQQAIDVSVRCVLDKPVKLEEIRNVALEALEHETDGRSG